MSSVHQAPLARLLRATEPATAVAFVAALYEARGWTVQSREERLLVVSDGDEYRRLGVVHPADDEPASELLGADRVIPIGEVGEDLAPNETAVIEPEALGQQLAYAIDRPVALELLDTYFDWSPEQLPDDGDPESADEPAGGAAEGDESVEPKTGAHDSGTNLARHTHLPSPPGRWTVLGVVVVVVVLIGAGVALSGGGSGGAVGVQDQNASTAPPVEAPSLRTPQQDGPAGAEALPGSSVATPASEQSSAQFRETNFQTYAEAPPGIVGPDEINIHQVTGAYQDLLDGRSYRLSLSYREFDDGRPTGVYRETISLESNERYSVDVSRVGTLRTRPFMIAGADLFANGSVEFERLGNGSVRTGPASTYDPFLVNTTQYMGWLFSVRNATIVDRQTTGNTTTYHVVTTGDPDPDFLNTSGSAFLTEAGLLRDGRWEFVRASNPDVRVVVRMGVTGVGSTTATRPAWVNGTD